MAKSKKAIKANTPPPTIYINIMVDGGAIYQFISNEKVSTENYQKQPASSIEVGDMFYVNGKELIARRIVRVQELPQETAQC